MDKITIDSAQNDTEAPPLSQAVINYSPQLFISGQLGKNPLNGRLVTSSIEEQVRQAFANFAAIVESVPGGSTTLSDVVKINIYLADMAYYPIANKVMRTFFSAPFPARSAICVASLNGAAIEIDGVVQLRHYWEKVMKEKQ